MAVLLSVLLWWAILLIVGLLTALWIHGDPARARSLLAEAREDLRLLGAAGAVRLEDLRAALRTRSPRTP